MSAIPTNTFSPDKQFRAEASPEKNFSLSRVEFVSLAADLRDGDHRLFEKVFLAHYEDCCAYLQCNENTTKEAARDAVMETLLRFRELLVAGKLRYGNLRFLFTRMARQELARRRHSLRRTDGALQGHDQWREHTFTEEEYGELTRAFRFLAPACRQLLIKFYYQQRSLRSIAEEEERPAPAVRKQKSRCVARLRKYFYPRW